jgi:hypothetical protein
MRRRRGRPPKDDETRKSAQLSVRIPAALRERLDAARRKSETDRSLSQEIEMRLRLSFEMDARIQDRFGGPTNYWLFHTMASLVRIIENQTGRRWWEDPYTFQQVKSCVEAIFRHLTPTGRVAIPKHFLAFPYGKQQAPTLGERLALLALANLEVVLRGDGDEGLPHTGEFFAAAGPLVPKLTKSALKQFLKQAEQKERKV